MIDHEGMWRLLQRFAGTLVERYALDDVLLRLGQDIRRILDVAGAGVMLEDDDGDLRFTSTSDEVLHALERLQVELDEGPCLLAYRSRERVIAADLAGDERFPRFGPRAVLAGMAAVYSFPMRVEDTVVGALNLYRGAPGELDAEQVEAGHVLADVATVYLVHADDVEQSKLLGERLHRALSSMPVIEQAKGYLVARLDIGVDEAREVIRAHARSTRRKLRDVAREVVDGDLDVARLVAGSDDTRTSGLRGRPSDDRDVPRA